MRWSLLILLLVGCSATEIIDTPSDEKKRIPASWNFEYETKEWKSTGDVPNCPELIFESPVDLNLVSGTLYPGQFRGGDYKAHGGFRFDGQSNEIEIRAIMDGYLLKASRYQGQGLEQILIFYVNECGIMIMHDHLVTVSPEIGAAMVDVPLNGEGDSRTTMISPRYEIKKGDIIATKIGLEDNVFVDFGLYDLRTTNGYEYDESFMDNYPSIYEYGRHALCVFDYLVDRDKVFSMPVGGIEGDVSDYCE